MPHKISQKRKVCVLVPKYPAHEEDSEASWLRESVNRLAARGHSVVVVVPGRVPDASPAIDGIRVLRFRHVPKFWSASETDEAPEMKAPSVPETLFSLFSLVMGAVLLTWWAYRERFEVIDVHAPGRFGLMALLPSWLLGIRTVATCHESELATAEQTPLGRRALRWSLRLADTCSSSSSHVADEVAELSGRTARIIPYRVSDSARLARGTRRRSPLAPATLLFSGHLNQRKGLLYLLKALPLVRKKRNVQLIVTGHGEARAEWERLVAELGLTDVVTFPGPLSGKDLGHLYQTCDIFVLPAIFDEPVDTDGLGLVLVEALINERPVIASAVAGIVEVIKHKRTGLLVPERSETALARAILRLLEDRLLARQLGRAGRDFAERHFDAERVASELEKLFNDALRPSVAPKAPLHLPSLTSVGAI
jgi:glycosyltransferase involved in cell wall biosynthesis